MPRTRPRSPHHLPWLLRWLRDDSGIVSLSQKRRHQGWLSGGCFPPPPHLCFPPQMHQSVHDIFVRLKTGVGHVYNHREEDIEQERRGNTALTKALFHSESPRVHLIIEPHACSHAIVELTNERDNILLYAKTGEYCPEEG